MDALTIDVFERGLFVFGLCVPRILMVLLVLPIGGPGVLPPTVRAGIAFSLALVVFPLVQHNYPLDGLNATQITALVVKELFVGLVIGYLVSILFWGMEAVGYFIDTHRGATISGSMHLTFGEETSPLGSLFVQIFTVLFFVSGGVYVFLAGLFHSYTAWPVLSYYPSVDLASVDFFISQFALISYLAVFIGGPVIIAMFLAEFSLALVSRFVPQLQVFFLSLPIKSGVAALLLVLYLVPLVAFLKVELAQIGILFSDLDVLFK